MRDCDGEVEAPLRSLTPIVNDEMAHDFLHRRDESSELEM